MGPRQTPPPLPDLEVNMAGRRASGRLQVTAACNWMQALEGDIDTVHLNFLHTRIDRDKSGYVTLGDSHPHFEMMPTDYGHYFGVRREVDDKYYWRINQFGMPFYTAVTGPFSKVWMPIDDYNTLVMEWTPAAPDMPREADDTGICSRRASPGATRPTTRCFPGQLVP